ncbi:MAG: DUF4365 domain-containing protein [Pseudomonadota bacterium]
MAYIHAIAAAAGFGIEKPQIDMDSVDLVVKQYGDSQLEDYPEYDALYVQLKCTSRSELIKADHIAYPLKIKNYNYLRKKTMNPSILIVLHVPEETQDWLKCSEQELTLCYSAYWLSLENKPDVTNGKKDQRVTVHVPLKNKLTVKELERIMNLLAKGEKP